MIAAMRTHRPIGKWPHVPLRTFQRRFWRALIVTLVLIPILAFGFSFIAASDPPLGNGGMPLDHWREALEAAALVALVGWVLFIILFGIARWIMTGEAPRHRSIEGALIARAVARWERRRVEQAAVPPHPELVDVREQQRDQDQP
jgi:hypothetical protein